jgi:hypothetical protein
MENIYFKKISPDNIKKKDPLSGSIAPTFNQPPPKIERNTFNVRCSKEKRRKLLRIYYNLKQRADKLNIQLPFIDSQDFIDFALQSNYTLGQRIRRSKDFNYHSRINIVFVDTKHPNGGSKNNKIQKRKREEEKIRLENPIKQEKKELKIEIPDKFPEE